MPILQAADLCKSYVIDKRQVNVLCNISFTMEEGEYVSVMGQSGSGKSTLLYAVSGMDYPTAGQVTIAGQSLGGMTENQLAGLRLEKMGFVFQQMYLMKNLSLYDNIILSAYTLGREDRGAINARARELMRRLGISEAADRDPSQVSGGQLQRACICRALINRPGILFADEPTGALNSAAAREVMDILSSVNQDGTSILLATHDSRAAARAGRVIFLADGRIRGELILGQWSGGADRGRERRLLNWLEEMEW